VIPLFDCIVLVCLVLKKDVLKNINKYDGKYLLAEIFQVKKIVKLMLTDKIPIT
jgi:hypothetical protein